MKLKSKVEVMNLPFLITAVYGSIVFIDIGWFSAGPNETKLAKQIMVEGNDPMYCMCVL